MGREVSTYAAILYAFEKPGPIPEFRVMFSAQVRKLGAWPLHQFAKYQRRTSI